MEKVAGAVIGVYERLAKRGKPDVARNEWTILAGFAALHPLWEAPLVLSLGTGTKCLPADQVAAHLVSDQHAEIVAKRALLVWLSNARSFSHKNVSIVDDEGRWNPEVQLVMYSSREPCGSSRITIAESQENKRIKVDHVTAMRKPGRGCTSLCVSCADKLTKWIALDLFSRLQHGPRLTCLVVGGKFDSKQTLEETLRERCHANVDFCLLHTEQEFVHDESKCPDAEQAHPSGLSINWMLGDVQGEVVQPNGKLMGANKSAAINPKHVSRISPLKFEEMGLTKRQGYIEAKNEWIQKYAQGWK